MFTKTTVLLFIIVFMSAISIIVSFLTQFDEIKVGFSIKIYSYAIIFDVYFKCIIFCPDHVFEISFKTTSRYSQL